MDLNINSSRPNFGMALNIEKSARRVIKRQLVGKSQKRVDKFWSEIRRIEEEQQDNPNDIFVRAAKHRNALVAEVVDSERELKTYTTSQRLLHRDGSTKFLNRAEERANNIKKLNDELENAPRRREEYFDEAEESGVRFADEAEELADEVQGGSIVIGGGDPAIKERSADSSPDINL